LPSWDALQCSLMPKLAHRFLPCGDDGRPRENSQYTAVANEDDHLGIGSVLMAEIFGFREHRNARRRRLLITATDADGNAVAIRGKLVCRGVRRQS
jgi:hypothetical protein